MSQNDLVGDVPTKSTLSSSSWKPWHIEGVSEPCESDFELGPTLKDAEIDVVLNHKNCSKFCVLGGANCSP